MDHTASTTALSNRSVSDSVMVALRKIIRAIEMNSKKLFKRVGLTGPQLVILQEISRREKITVGDIAQAVSLSQATVTGILERMENRGLLARERSNQDKRRIMVSISATGKQILKDAPPLMQEAFVEKFACLEEWEQTMILSALQRLVTIMDAKSIQATSSIDCQIVKSSETSSRSF